VHETPAFKQSEGQEGFAEGCEHAVLAFENPENKTTAKNAKNTKTILILMMF
jgi:hypothetical protein